MGWSIVAGLQAADVLPRNFIRFYEVVALLFLLAGGALVFGGGRVLCAACSRDEVVLGITLMISTLGALTCQYFPGASYLFLWPALWLVVTWSLVGLNSSRFEERQWLMCMLWCLVPAVIYSPTYVMLAQTLGPRAGSIITAAVALMLLPTWIPLADKFPLSKDLAS